MARGPPDFLDTHDNFPDSRERTHTNPDNTDEHTRTFSRTPRISHIHDSYTIPAMMTPPYNPEILMSTQEPASAAKDPAEKRHATDIKPKLVKTSDTHKYYACQFLDCPRPTSMMKRPRSLRGRPPNYHPDCRKALLSIRYARDGSPDGRPPISEPTADNPRGLDPLQPDTPEDRKRLDTPICGEKRRGAKPGICCMPAGWGTKHNGVGPCKLHFGNSLPQEKAAAREILFRETAVLGAPISIDPHTAVLQEIHRTAGHVEWIRTLIHAMGVDPDTSQGELVFSETGVIPKGVNKTIAQYSESGMAPSVWMDLYLKERTHLVRTCKMAVDMGCAERTVQLAEDQGRMIATVMSKIFNNPALALTNVQKAALGPVVRQELLALTAESESTVAERTP